MVRASAGETSLFCDRLPNANTRTSVNQWMSHRSSDWFQNEAPQFVLEKEKFMNNTQRSRQDIAFSNTLRQKNRAN